MGRPPNPAESRREAIALVKSSGRPVAEADRSLVSRATRSGLRALTKATMQGDSAQRSAGQALPSAGAEGR